MNIPPTGTYDCVTLFWFERYMEDWKVQGIATERITEESLKAYVAHGFSRNGQANDQTNLHYCQISFFKDGTKIELWDQLEMGIDYEQSR